MPYPELVFCFGGMNVCIFIVWGPGARWGMRTAGVCFQTTFCSQTVGCVVGNWRSEWSVLLFGLSADVLFVRRKRLLDGLVGLMMDEEGDSGDNGESGSFGAEPWSVCGNRVLK